MELKFSWSCGKTRVPVAELAIPGLPQVHPCLATAEEAAGDERTPAGQQEGSAGRGDRENPVPDLLQVELVEEDFPPGHLW